MVTEEKLGRNVDELMKQVGLRECVVILISTHAEGNVYGVPHRKRKRKIEDNNVCFLSDPCHFLFFFQLRYTNKGTRGGTQAIINGVCGERDIRMNPFSLFFMHLHLQTKPK